VYGYLTKNYDEFNLRAVITSNGGEVMDFEKIEARPAAVTWRRKSQELQQDLEDARERLRRLREERDALHGRPSSEKSPPESNARLEELKKENTRLQKELEKIKEEMRDLDNQIHRDLQKAANKKTS
jgi:predicted nuclease with TOPRIM domain